MEAIVKKSPNGTHYTLVDSSVVDNFESKRVICTVNNRLSFHCAFNYSKTQGNYIYLNKNIIDQLGLQLGDVIMISFKKDDSKYQFDMPEEFAEVLRTDEHALKVFDSLTPGNQRGIIHLIGKLKSPDKRLEKSFQFAEKLKMGITRPQDIIKK